jgi:hypothetical protein
MFFYIKFVKPSILEMLSEADRQRSLKSPNGVDDSPDNNNLSNRSGRSNQQEPSWLNQNQQHDKVSTPYEDRVIPTLRHVNTGVGANNNKSRLEKYEQGQPIAIGSDDENLTSEAVVPASDFENELTENVYDANAIDGTEEMTERDVREAALMNDFLGKQIVSGLSYQY